MITTWVHKFAVTAFAVATLLFLGCAQQTVSGPDENKPAIASPSARTTANILTGSIVGKSNKAQTVSIEVGKGTEAQTIMLKFDDQTIGLKYAEPGEAAIINWEQRGDDQFATVIKPKLATLPEGVTEIGVDELYQLIENHTPMTLIDARPEMRYQQAHLPGAINVPVPLLKEKNGEVLPADKNGLLIFYCGGYT